MKKMISLLCAAAMVLSLAACSSTPETTTEETTTEETTTEETSAESSEETSVESSEETSVESSEGTSETSETTTKAPTKKPTKKPTKVPVKPTYIPKGWEKLPDLWGVKQYGRKVYVIYHSKKYDQYKGWYKGKWIKLYETSKTIHNHEDEEHDYVDILRTYYRDKKHKHKYASFHDD